MAEDDQVSAPPPGQAPAAAGGAGAAPARRRMHGAPAQGFAERLQLTRARWEVDRKALLLLLVAWPLMARRVSLPLAGHLWIASQCVICAVQIVLRRRRAPLAWQEAAAVAYRLNSCGWGQLSVLMKLWLDHAAVATGPLALLWHALLLFFSSSAATLLLIPANALRLSLALPVQLGAVLRSAAFNAHVCAGAALAHPLAQQHTHRLFWLLESCSYSLGPVAADVQPATECTAVLTYFQLAIGLLLPAVAQMAAESSLFQEHQKQRGRQDIQPECGWQQHMYDGLSGMAEALDGVTLAAAAWMALGIVWQVSVGIAYRQEAAAR